MHLSGQDCMYLFLWRNPTQENERFQDSSQAGKVYSRVTGRAPRCLSFYPGNMDCNFPILFPKYHWILFNLDASEFDPWCLEVWSLRISAELPEMV